jgi:hypothetical protein
MENFPHPLADPAIIAELRSAWRDSVADDPANRHEEGGYILVMPDGSYEVERWRRGEQSYIDPPPLDENHCYNGKAVVAAFHTHPNPPQDEMGREWEQGPGGSDRRWHQRKKIRGFVISRSLIFEIDLNANVSVIGKREEVLAE